MKKKERHERGWETNDFKYVVMLKLLFMFLEIVSGRIQEDFF